jgi:hypothetical protein
MRGVIILLEKIKKYIRDDYFKIFEGEQLVLLEENEIDGYAYSVLLPHECSLALHLRMDNFVNEDIPYVNIKGCKDCDDIIIDETNKTVYIMEVKKPSAFRCYSAKEFELKEQYTKLFLEYFFMLCDSFEKLNDYKINYIRWCYEKRRASSTRKGMDNFYFQYRRADEKAVYKIDRLDKILLDKLYRVSNYIE